MFLHDRRQVFQEIHKQGIFAALVTVSDIKVIETGFRPKAEQLKELKRGEERQGEGFFFIGVDIHDFAEFSGIGT